MTRDDILTLARAGFSAEQIAALSTIQPALAPAPDPVPAPAPDPVPAPAPSSVDALLAKLGVLTDTIQANGINGSNQPKQETADDILAAIIAPPRPPAK